MECIARFDSRLSQLAAYLTGNKKRAFAAGVAVYTAVFALFFCISVLPVIADTGTLLGGDGVAQYYPYLLDFRRNIIELIDSVKSGSPQLTMMNFNYCCGIDTVTSTAMNFMPLLPFYALSAFVAESDVPMLFAVGAVLLAYMAGIAFMCLCAHFRLDMLWSGLMAPFYVFCGNYFFTGSLNPQFLYMYVAFPLMIIGIDRILTRRGWALLTLSVGWLALSGFVMLIYTLPFVVVFAIVRVYFLYRGEFFKNLLRYFLRGSLAVLLGAAMAGFMLLPVVMEYFNSDRSSGVSGALAALSAAELLTPSAEYLSELLSGTDPNSPTGVCAVLTPCFLYVLTSDKTRREVKGCCFTMLVLVALPLIRYGLNGFQYELCRWGFVPALLVCFCCAAYAPRFLHIGAYERGVFIFSLAGCILLLTLRQDTAAVIFVLAAAVLNTAPFTRGLLKRAAKIPKRFAAALKNEYRAKGQYLYLTAAALGFMAAAALIFYAVINAKITVYPFLVIAAAGFLLIACLSAKNCRSTAGMLLAVLCISVGAFSNSTAVIEAYIIQPDEALTAIADTERQEGYWGRVCAITDDCKGFLGMSSAEEAAVEVDGKLYGRDTNLNAALRYDIADTSVFRSTVNGDYMGLFSRCGQECTSLSSTGQINGLAGKEVLYSLLGVERLYSVGAAWDFYGFQPTEQLSCSDGTEVQYYRNMYALPMGVTYDSLMEGDEFDDLNGAELPYAMLDSVYLEGFELPDSAPRADSSYAYACDFTLRQELRGETSFGIECYDNYITLGSDTAGCFIYLSFDGVNSSTYEAAQSEDFTVNVDDRYEVHSLIHNQNSSWEWAYRTDHYTFALGFAQEGIDSISFISPFEFENVYVYAVPEEVYTSAYSERTEEILEGVELSTNELTGSITVSEDKILSINMLYSDGWTAYIDGAEVPIYKANGLFIGIPLSEGEHSVRLIYRTPWLYEGAALSCAAAAVFVALLIISRRRNKAAVSKQN